MGKYILVAETPLLNTNCKSTNAHKYFLFDNILYIFSVFFASTSHELLSEFFNKTMAQVTAVRQWKEPVLYGNSIPLDHSPIAELQESVYEENLMSTESSIISKLVIA